MRSAGCAMNDIADRHIDGHVERTRHRPLARGVMSVREALIVVMVLAALAFSLVLFCNRLTRLLAIAGALLTVTYPYLKRFTHLPQMGLGVAFAWGVPMAFAAVTGNVDARAWFLFAAVLVWPVIYDTMYAMVDREDDIKIGVKSTAILFGERDRLVIASLQMLFIAMLAYVGDLFHLQSAFYYCLLLAATLFLYQQWLIRDSEPAACFDAFLNNGSVGLAVFLGILWGIG